ncbi:tRNA (5-methylaminomethyl-2-thiouridine)(34)-methyltransferase MnmD [Tritonibacter horizontis]|uniref:tRNA 5-methylaminomethyl-2-thiouridine biosynthesis bifunctional protein MnmC n=1 Tax=Tritonibacter horizontis TaxID=1768241 RepID=A0A132BU28_9RHOB|nr:tRNA (5-methylaminomethyl-2-thiouridine)(34)-methyltransferase MnmD [Tritonibacter horizontis]KUP91327.1 tRNA 5-methylaminomethyl-2-thiouridine biosynthesis bifunctional protein MnmC [Tritonibacter horizontis]
MADQQARLSWRDGSLPVSDQFDDPYFSLHNGLLETEHVFLAGNDLPLRFGTGFQIAELGFGTGLNMLAAWRAWEDSGQAGALRFTSFEAYPMRPADMARALEAFPAITPWAERFLEAWSGGGRCDLGTLRLEVVIGDARQTVPSWTSAADAWFLDGFSPAKNPELWQDDLMQAVADHTRDSGTAATYTAAGFVRRGLAAAGFQVTRTAGFGHKRHMTQARLAPTQTTETSKG